VGIREVRHRFRVERRHREWGTEGRVALAVRGSQPSHESLEIQPGKADPWVDQQADFDGGIGLELRDRGERSGEVAELATDEHRAPYATAGACPRRPGAKVEALDDLRRVALVDPNHFPEGCIRETMGSDPAVHALAAYQRRSSVGTGTRARYARGSQRWVTRCARRCSGREPRSRLRARANLGV